MKRLTDDRELVLEIGLAAVGLGILAGVASLIVGRLAGDRRRSGRYAEPPPGAGSVPPERH